MKKKIQYAAIAVIFMALAAITLTLIEGGFSFSISVGGLAGVALIGWATAQWVNKLAEVKE